MQSSAEAATAAEKAIALLSKPSLSATRFHAERERRISMSLAHGKRVEQLLKSADEAMYRAKRGRPRVSLRNGAADAPMSNVPSHELRGPANWCHCEAAR